MTDQTEKFKSKEVTPLDSKVRAASEVETKLVETVPIDPTRTVELRARMLAADSPLQVSDG